MKVVLINTSDAGGGAPAACTRLLHALRWQGVDAQLLVQYKKTGGTAVEGVVKNAASKLRAQFTFFAERIPFILFHEKDRSVRFAFSPADSGTSITNNELIKQADILHLHWTNSGFLSVADLEELIKTGKPIIWTLHDMWTFTGGCHYSGACGRFETACGNCPFLKDAGVNDLSHTGWLRKAKMYADAKNVTFVACSKWLAGVAAKSSLVGGLPIKAIPNPIDINTFSPRDKAAERQKHGINVNAKVVLFGAANINDKRKGIGYLVDALRLLKDSTQDTSTVEVVIFGKNKHFDVSQLLFPVHQLNIISDESEMAAVYSLADVFVTTALEDNLPNTVMEAMACGTPVVAFKTGGIPEMVDHLQNGYLAELKSAQGIADGVNELLFKSDSRQLSDNTRRKVLDNYTNEKVAQPYIELYRSVLNK